ncbi:MAG: hypothetical protein HY432_00540 [Candidatus Liptonbacteria bacterium]|nr:hypothetical protein [Candidatus Liptonbacteria bacterium]
MPQFTAKTWAVIVIAFAAVLIIILYRSPENQVNAPSSEGEVAVSSTPSTPSSSAPGQQTSLQKPATVQKEAISIKIISPLQSEQWAIGESHTISWSREAGVSGQIYLASASTRETVGWIHSSTGPNQTSFSWSTSDVALSRSSALRKNIGVGNYIIKIKFDNPKIAESSSGVFSILYPSEIKPVSHSVTIQNYTASPSSITVKRGEQVIFTNKDQIMHTLIVATGIKVVVVPGQSSTFDTKILTAAPYNAYSEQYPSLKLLMDVK